MKARACILATHTTLWRAADTLLKSALSGDRFAIRLLGMGVSGLEHGPDKQLRFFRTSKPSTMRSIGYRIRSKIDSAKERCAVVFVGLNDPNQNYVRRHWEYLDVVRAEIRASV